MALPNSDIEVDSELAFEGVLDERTLPAGEPLCREEAADGDEERCDAADDATGTCDVIAIAGLGASRAARSELTAGGTGFTESS